MSIEFLQENRWIDGIDGGAGDLRNDFIEQVRKQFTEEELSKWNIEVNHFNHVPQHIVNALETNKNQTIDGDTLSIEVSIEGQFFALLYERRTETNHAELAYFINKQFLEYLRKGEHIDIGTWKTKGTELSYILNPSSKEQEDIKKDLIEKVYSSTFLKKQENNYGFVFKKDVYHLEKGDRYYSTKYDRHTIELTISNHLVALLYERKQDDQEEVIQLINHTMLKQQNTNELANQYKYDRLRYGFRLIHSIDDEDFEAIKHIINQTELSDYMMNQEDFLAIKNDNDQIVAFGRLFPIGEGQKEISSLWVDESERGSKLGLYLSKKLIDEKKGDDDVYLMSRKELADYYTKLGFSPVKTSLPEKWKQSERTCETRGIEMIVMEYR